MRFTCTIEMDNQAFEETPEHELNRLLDVAGGWVARGHREGVLFDSNGNRVGEWSIG